MKKIFRLIFWLVLTTGLVWSITYKSLADLPYYKNPVNDAYHKKRYKLDLYYPDGSQNYPTVIWSNGGGLKSGSKVIPQQLKCKGLALAEVNYRFYPIVNTPKYIEDASAVAWVFKNIEQYGGDSKKIYVSGFYYRGYLSFMLGLDQKWLKKRGLEGNQIKGIISLSSTIFTNHTIRKEYGIEITQTLIDRYVQVYYA